MSKDLTSAERKFIFETQAVLTSGNTKTVLAKLNELKSTGSASVFPFILDLLLNDDEEVNVVHEVLQMLGDLKDQACAPIIVEYIAANKFGIHLAGILAACWQSRLDFSPYIETFIHTFIGGDYQEAIEAFTVIEEMLWKSTPKEISFFRSVLLERQKAINPEKELLFRELLKVLNEGGSSTREDYPDVFER